ncbi:MAG: CBS domain-containing protein [Spirochaetes bacterium]|nr:CBS domain-containing protein [Spirochaetota bacterium]MBL7006724.1 CBS domain-containing protein [Spirochaetia bacterium]
MKSIPINTDNPPTVILELIYRLKVKEVMSSSLFTAEKTTSLRTIQKLMRRESITGVPIVQGKRILGIVSMDDIIQALDHGHIEEPAENFMSRNLIVLEDDMPISFAISYFDKYSYHRFPVLNKKQELVGMITPRDIASRLLLEFNREIDSIERISSHDSVVGIKETRVRKFTVRKHDFENAGYASTEIKKYLKSMNYESALIRKASIASYELEINLAVHSAGGEMIAEFTENKLVITAKDSGPGIPDIEKALTEGFSTANSWIRTLGFGAGMGLPNVQRVADDFSITSDLDTGTTVTAAIYLK